MKLFASLYQGTLRGRSDEILVFTNLLAHADQHGIVDKHWQAIADETGLTKDRAQVAITNLEAPDPESRSPEMDGCRITRLDEHRAWGWQIVNYGKYRAIRNEEDRREQNRLAQERWRSKQSKQSKPPSSQAEAEAEAEAGKPALRADADPAKQEIWNTGKAMLGKEGASFLGKLVKDYGQKLVLQAIRDCEATQPASPKEWLVARCQERRGTGTGFNKQEALEERNRRVAENWQPPADDERH